MTYRTVRLSAAGTTLVLGVPETGLPHVLHWGAYLPDTGGLAAVSAPPAAHNGVDVSQWLSLVPTQPEGWRGHPGIAGHHEGRATFPDWTVREVREDPLAGAGPGVGGALTVLAEAAGLELRCELRMEASGLVRARNTVTNTDADPWTLDTLRVTLPLPREAEEVLDLTGRWCRERSPQRQELTMGTRLRASRRGRTGHDAPLLLVAGTPGFGFRGGEVWGVHTAWSGDHVHLAERLPEGAGQADAVIAGGELLHPGEVRLARGESYSTPWVFLSWSDRGLDGMSARIHRWLRARPHHPSSPRPVVLNTWEAVYFDHDLATLKRLADTAAGIGVERFVLDDGWFRGRRDDTAGLGDWTVDTGVWPEGLHPLFVHVRSRGMRVGLWVEPEMVNPDSDLVRAHPEWILAAEGRTAPPSRNQQLLDLSRPEAFRYVFECLDALVTEYRLDYLKWDHNRDLLEPVHAPTGGAGTHRQTLAAYALLDRLRERHPALEVESCSSGGGRVDLGILERTDRVWASDTNDPLERLAIQRWTALLLPPELVGSHVGGRTAHTTGRDADLSFRCLAGLMSHAGIEWDITRCTDDELGTLASWIGLYKELRPLLHSGEAVHADTPDPADQLDGVVDPDGSEAVFRYARLATSARALPGRVRLPGLRRDLTYRLVWRREAGRPSTMQHVLPEWFAEGGATVSGAVLTRSGVQLPNLNPSQALLLHLREA
ncbi:MULTISPECIES: alpha-galactosidase [Nocardiopsis]|uniref:Alpha-galactosidase n=1 Tax=Nocardiopsis sinuspersici TaxID=501010 RepID=A0A1V3C7E0_9ACTN|nr:MULTISPECIES: alpha-galactosidase [Nocardiopsis]OOC56552.1 alpha-galactosidase [Nocardiopsis sinuspersici]